MKFYKLTALTPVLVGDGQRLSPIDYMVWRDQVNVLDQAAIFKLLARGPRLEGISPSCGGRISSISHHGAASRRAMPSGESRLSIRA